MKGSKTNAIVDDHVVAVILKVIMVNEIAIASHF